MAFIVLMNITWISFWTLERTPCPSSDGSLYNTKESLMLSCRACDMIWVWSGSSYWSYWDYFSTSSSERILTLLQRTIPGIPSLETGWTSTQESTKTKSEIPNTRMPELTASWSMSFWMTSWKMGNRATARRSQAWKRNYAENLELGWIQSFHQIRRP